jgi:hypothetical protein
MNKSLFEDELVSSMEKQLRKQGSAEKPSLVKAAECLHAALEIFEEQGMTARADQVLQLLQKLAQSNEARDVQQMPTPKALMEAGLTQRDMHEFAKGNPVATAKFNLVLRRLGLSDHQIGRFIGPTKVMSEADAKELIDPNRSFGKIHDWMQDPTTPVDPRNPKPGETISFRSVPLTGPGDTLSFESLKDKPKPTPPGEALEFKSIAQKKSSDRHTKGLTPEKEVENLKHHGTPFNMADDTFDVGRPVSKGNLRDEDLDPDFAELLKSPSFDMDASDDELMGMEIKEDTLEVSEGDISLEDFEDERD